MKNSLFAGLAIRMLLMVGLFSAMVFALTQSYQYSALLTGTLSLVVCVEALQYVRNKLLFYDKAILAMIHEDYSAGFPAKYRDGSYKNLYRLYHQQKERTYAEVSREMVYRSIFDNVDTGILILKKTDARWDIFMMNDYFSRLFGVPKVSRFDLLRNYLPDICDEIEHSGFSERKATVSIRIDQKEPQTFIMQGSVTKSFDSEYYIVLLDSIQRVIEKKEKEAWINLMKIIAHELMNSLTPIRSLSQSLQEILAQPQLAPEDLQDVRESLATIVGRSDHLQSFVENYRKLTMLPTPEKDFFDLSELIKESIKVMQPVLKQERIDCHIAIDRGVMAFADRSQMGQVIINLLTNSIHALREREHKEILIESKSEGNRLFLFISDTGKGIEDEIREKIFLPFFTTRKDGAGIGLTLSKNIIEAHGGYLSYSEEGERTRFAICLIEP